MPLTLYRRGSIWHFRGTVAKRRISGSTRTADKAIAQRIAAEAETRVWRGHLDGPGASVMFSHATTAYMDAQKPTRFVLASLDHFKDTLLSDITTGAVRQFAIERYPEAKAATRNRQAIVPTQAIINHAAALGWCNKISVPRFKVETKVKYPATLEWVSKFAEAASPHLGALAYFMFGTGARIGEAVALTWGAVNMQNRTAIINQSKTGSERRAHLPGPVVAALANIPSNHNPAQAVFRYVAADSAKQPWDHAVKRAGIARLTPHSCRHGFATMMLRAGYDVKTVAKLGGWKDAATVLKHYAHAVDDPTLTDALFGTNLTQPGATSAATIRKKRVIKP